MKPDTKGIILAFVYGIIIDAIITLCTSCSHYKYVTTPEVHTQYVNVTDSFMLHDTLIVNTQTVVREVDSATMAQYGIRLAEQAKAYLVQINNLEKKVNASKTIAHDTIIKHDSIPYTIVQEKTKLQYDYSGWYAFIILLVIVGAYIYVRKKRITIS